MPTMLDYSQAETSAERQARRDPEGVLSRVCGWQSKSKADVSAYQQRWADNLRLMKGVWAPEEKTRSEVRGRSKLFFRKIWSTVWRLMASMYNAFLRDPDQVRLQGRMGNDQDVHKAGVLQVMAEYHRDRMYRTQDLFLQHLWGF